MSFRQLIGCRHFALMPLAKVPVGEFYSQDTSMQTPTMPPNKCVHKYCCFSPPSAPLLLRRSTHPADLYSSLLLFLNSFLKPLSHSGPLTPVECHSPPRPFVSALKPMQSKVWVTTKVHLFSLLLVSLLSNPANSPPNTLVSTNSLILHSINIY